MLVAGVLGDLWNRKYTLVVALLIWSAATFASGLAASFTLLIVLRSVVAFGEAFYYPAANSVISDYHGPTSRATAMAVHQTAAYAGIVVSGTLAGYIGEHLGWRQAFIIFGAVGVLVAWVTGKVLREPRRGQADEAEVQHLRQPGVAVAADPLQPQRHSADGGVRRHDHGERGLPGVDPDDALPQIRTRPRPRRFSCHLLAPRGCGRGCDGRRQDGRPAGARACRCGVR